MVVPKDFFHKRIPNAVFNYFNKISLKKYNHILPTVEKAKEIFGDFDEIHTNLFRFMTFIIIII